MTNDRGHLGLTEIATRLGVSRQRVGQLVASYPDFPAPADELSMGKVWHADAVEEWIKRHPTRRSGVHRRHEGRIDDQ